MFEAVTPSFETWNGPARATSDEETARFRILIPVSGGPNAGAALGVLPGLAAPENEIVFLHVRSPGDASGPGVAQKLLDAVTGLPHLDGLEVYAEDAPGTIVDVSDCVDLVVLGASNEGPVFGPPIMDLVRRNKCPTIVVRRELKPRHVDRTGPRALVVAESSQEGVLCLERALRWAKAGSVTQDVLFVPARGEVRAPSGQVLGVAGILDEVRASPRDLVVLACDTSDGIEPAWASEVAAGVECSIVGVFASSTGPRTRRRRTTPRG